MIPVMPPVAPTELGAKMFLKVLAAFAAAGLLIFAVWFVAIRPHQAIQQAAQAETSANAAQADAKAAEGTVVIQRQHDADVARIQQQTEESSHEIHKAPGAEAHLSPDLDMAGRRALCLHDGRANEPACRALLHPHG